MNIIKAYGRGGVGGRAPIILNLWG